MANFDDVIFSKYSSNFKGYTGNPPETEDQYSKMDLWIDKSVAPTWETIVKDMDKQEVIAARKKAYPEIGEQLGMLWDAIDGGSLDKTSDFYKNIKSVKDANPFSGE
jgi:hypothetical protein